MYRPTDDVNNGHVLWKGGGWAMVQIQTYVYEYTYIYIYIYIYTYIYIYNHMHACMYALAYKPGEKRMYGDLTGTLHGV